jgi:hypothetical protein
MPRGSKDQRRPGIPSEVRKSIDVMSKVVFARSR